jgi:hypothetical protein
MGFRLVEVGYKVVKLGKHAVSCPMGALRGVTGAASLPTMRLFGSASTLALSAMMFLQPSVANAEVTLIDGGDLSGFLITGTTTLGNGGDASLTSYRGASTNIDTTENRQTIFTGFVTQGGAGSGGGAGLGGVFFVNSNANLTLNNVVFAGNSVKGGTGGGEPSQRVGNVAVALATKTIDVFKVEQQLVTPVISYTGGAYQFNTLDVSATGVGLLAAGAPLTFGTLNGDPTTSIDRILSGDQILLKDTIQLTNADVTSVAQFVDVGLTWDPNNPMTQVGDTRGYRVSGNTIDLTRATSAQRSALADKVEINSFVFINGTSSRVTSVSIDGDGNLESITLADNALQGRSGQLDVISLSSFTARQFEVGDVGGTPTTGKRQVTLKGDLRGFEPGMALFDGNGNALGLTVDEVLDGGATVVVEGTEANLNRLNTVDNFLGRKSPVISSTQIALNSPRSDFYNGATVYLSDLDRTEVVQSYDSVTGVITFASPLSTAELATLTDLSNKGKAINVQLNNIVSAAGNEIRVRADGLDLQAGMELQGSGISGGATISNVTVANGIATIQISGGTITPSELSFFVAKSPLSKGGNMNGMTESSVGSNGRNGFDSNGFAAFFEGGEGQEGTRGYSGEDLSDGVGGVGGDGGIGGNGSDGMPINPQAIQGVIDATGGFIDATGELVAAIFPDPVVGLAVPIPDPLEIAGATVDLAFATLDLATAIYENVQWGINLSRGIAGMGGDGGEGGEAGGGSDFFGGGAGGAGGNGGEGALSFTDGGSGGDGGRGGDGGFGAGGGQGGAGGESGSTGAADGGNPGDGGFGGFGAGDGSNGNSMFGGGGSGFGGAIFVRADDTGIGSLTVRGDAHFLNNVARGGSSTNRGAAGDGAGAAMFIMKGASVRL